MCREGQALFELLSPDEPTDQGREPEFLLPVALGYLLRSYRMHRAQAIHSSSICQPGQYCRGSISEGKEGGRSHPSGKATSGLTQF